MVTAANGRQRYGSVPRIFLCIGPLRLTRRCRQYQRIRNCRCTRGTGVGTENTIKQQVRAEITGGSNVTATGGRASVTATDSSTEINADAGAVAVGFSTFIGQRSCSLRSVGIAVALNTVESTVTAAVDNSKLTAGSITVLATSKKAADSTAAFRYDALAFGRGRKWFARSGPMEPQEH